MKGKHKTMVKKEKPKPKLNERKVKVIIALLVALIVAVMVLKPNEEQPDYIVETNNQIETQQNEIVTENTDNSQTGNIINEQNETKENEIEIGEKKVTSRGSNFTERQKTTILQEPVTMYVTTEQGLNVRESYNKNSKIVKTLSYRTKVTVTEKYEKEWAKIGDNQWVSLQYLSETQPKAIEKVSTTTTKIQNSIPENGEWIKFTATSYCSCAKCCNKATGITASGTKATAGRTIAMPKGYAFGTKILMKDSSGKLLNNGQPYVVEDRGGAINGKVLDIYANSHQKALNWGRRTVYIMVVK